MKIEEMSLKQKLGQLLVTGFPGQQMSDEFRALVKEYALGNVILFKYNQQTEAQLKTLCADLDDFIVQNTGIAPLISSDEEGGVVSRLPDDMVQMPSAMFLVHQLRGFYKDLQDKDYQSAIALVHSRFSTNTNPSWERAHPNRMLLHNGEINTIRGNADRMILPS